MKIPFTNISIDLKRERRAITLDPVMGPAMTQKDGKTKVIDGVVIKGGRSSVSDSASLYGLIMGEMALTEPDYPIQMIRVIRHLAKYNADLSYAVANIQNLANTQYEIAFNEDVSPEITKKIQAQIKAENKKWYSGGLHSLINDLLAQLAMTGAASAEIIPNLDLNGLNKVALVKTDEVVWFYDKPTDTYMPFQRVNHVLLPNTVSTQNLVPLNPVTFKYHAITRHDDKPYAIPPFLSALESIEIEKDMVQNLKNIIRNMGLFGFLSVLVNAPKPKQNEPDQVYLARATAYLDQVLPEIQKGFSSGLAVGFEGTHKFEMQSTMSNPTGAKDIIELVLQMKMSGLKQDPLMLGRNFNVAETMAQVILSKLGTQIRNYQSQVEDFVSEVILMWCWLNGYTMIKSVFFELGEAMIGDEKAKEETKKIKLDNLKTLYMQGIIGQQEFAEEAGYEEFDQLEPREEFSPRDEPSTGAAGGTKKPATKKPTKAKQIKVTLNKRIITMLHGVTAPLQAVEFITATGSVVEAYVLYGTEAVVEEGTDISQFVDVTVKDWRYLAEELGMSLPMFNYTTECACGHDHFDSAKDKVDRYMESYLNAAKGVYVAGYEKAVKEVAKVLSKMGEGATLEQVTDKVLYTLYKNWKGDFTAGQARVVDKWVKLLYKEFRKDKSPFGEVPAGKTIPDAAFSVRDFRTMKYYEKSDNLYLGKFVTDEDTRQRLTEFIKQEYIDKGLPIGTTNEESMSKFKEKFGKMFEGEEWKLTRIVATTVGKLKNYASVSYMTQANVSLFKIVGINDRKQCPYCSFMQGKEFSLATAQERVDKVVASEPAFVKEDSPFITSVFSGKEGLAKLQGLTGKEIQDAGIDVPPYHSSCRDRVVAVLD